MNARKKVLLLTPPYSIAESLGKLGIFGGRLPAIGLLYLAAAVRPLCHVRMIDGTCSGCSNQDILHSIGQDAPDIVGISAVTPAITRAQALAAEIKRSFPRILVVLGGPHLTTVPEETMRRTPAIDVGVIGEGERTLREIVAAYDGTTESLRGVAGLILRPSPGGAPALTPPRSLIDDIDELGLPAYDLIAGCGTIMPAPFKTRRLPAIHAITSRGCAHRCGYCNTNLFNKRLRFHSADYVLELVRLLMNAGYREIAFEDDNFTAHRGRLTEICARLIAGRLDISWSVNARIDCVDGETLGLMKRAGCWYISYGIESGSQETLDRVGKKITLDEIRRKVELTRAAGIEAKGFFIVGFPWETERMVRQTVDFALSLPLSDVNIFPLTPFPGTELYAQAKSCGDFSDDWSRMDLQQIVYVPPGLSARLLRSQINRLLLGFYLRPTTVAHYLRRAFGAREVILRLAKEFVKR